MDSMDKKKILQRLSAQLFRSFEPIDVLPHLQVRDIVSRADVDRIRREPERKFRVADLVSVLQSNEASLTGFVEALEESGNGVLATELRRSLAGIGPVPPTSSPLPHESSWVYLQQQDPTQLYPASVADGQKLEKIEVDNVGILRYKESLGDELLKTAKIPDSDKAKILEIDGSRKMDGDPFQIEVLSRRLAGGKTGKDSEKIRANFAKSFYTALRSGNVKRLRQFFESKRAGDPHPNDMRFFLQKTKFNEKEIRDWFQEFARLCPDGRLTKDQFADFYKRLHRGESFSNEFCEHVFRCFDWDRSGYIDFKEFLIALNVRTAGSPEQKLEWTFRLYDIDGNGSIDMHEMFRITLSLFEMLGSEKEFGANGARQTAFDCAQVIFRQMDRDQNGLISREEFVEGCLKDPQLFQILTAASTATN